MRINIITPTVCRPTLTRTIASVWPQLKPGDDHWILPDVKAMGCTMEEAQARVMALSPPPVDDSFTTRYAEPVPELESDGPGNAQRNYAMDWLRKREGEWVMFLDDDDVLERTALQRIRIYLHGEPKCHLFPMLDPERKLLHNYGIIVRGGIGGSQIVCPTGPGLPRWGKGYAGDFDFIIDAIKAFGFEGHWGEPPIVIVRPPGDKAVVDHTEFPLLDYLEHKLAGGRFTDLGPGEIVL